MIKPQPNDTFDVFDIQTRRYNRSNHDLPWIKILYNLAICMRIKILSYSYNYLSNVTNTEVDIGEKWSITFF